MRGLGAYGTCEDRSEGRRVGGKLVGYHVGMALSSKGAGQAMRREEAA